MTPSTSGYTVSDDFNVFVVSDGTAKTALMVVQAALAQFDLPRVRVLPFGQVRNQEALYNILDMVRVQRDIMVYTLVNGEIAQLLRAEAVNRGIVVIDLLGPLVDVLHRISSRQPRGEAGLFQRLEDSSDKTQAIEYTLEQSTGFSEAKLDQADVILLTVMFPHRDECMFMLAEQGIKCGFLLLDPHLFPSPHWLQVMEKMKQKVVGVTADLEYLRKIRLERLQALGLDCLLEKADLQEVKKEAEFAQKIFEELKCPVIDITNLSSREIADQILSQIQRKKEEAK